MCTFCTCMCLDVIQGLCNPAYIHTHIIGWGNLGYGVLTITQQILRVPMFATIFGARDQFHGRQFFCGPSWRDSFGMIQEHYIYCSLYFCCYHISSTSVHQALDPRGWGPLF